MRVASLTDDLDGVGERRTSPDETVIRVFCMRTDCDAYPSEWAYKPHHGATAPSPDSITSTGMVDLFERLWSESPKSIFGVT